MVESAPGLWVRDIRVSLAACLTASHGVTVYVVAAGTLNEQLFVHLLHPGAARRYRGRSAARPSQALSAAVRVSRARSGIRLSYRR